MFRLLLLVSLVSLAAGCVTFKGTARWCMVCSEVTVEAETEAPPRPQPKTAPGTGG